MSNSSAFGAAPGRSRGRCPPSIWWDVFDAMKSAADKMEQTLLFEMIYESDLDDDRKDYFKIKLKSGGRFSATDTDFATFTNWTKQLHKLYRSSLATSCFVL